MLVLLVVPGVPVLTVSTEVVLAWGSGGGTTDVNTTSESTTRSPSTIIIFEILTDFVDQDILYMLDFFLLSLINGNFYGTTPKIQ